MAFNSNRQPRSVSSSAELLRRFRLEDHASSDLTIHRHLQRFIEPEMANAILLFDRKLADQPFPIDEALAGVGIHREIADLESRQILKKMAALRGRNPKVAEPGFHNHS